MWRSMSIGAAGGIGNRKFQMCRTDVIRGKADFLDTMTTLFPLDTRCVDACLMVCVCVLMCSFMEDDSPGPDW